MGLTCWILFWKDNTSTITFFILMANGWAIVPDPLLFPLSYTCKVNKNNFWNTNDVSGIRINLLLLIQRILKIVVLNLNRNSSFIHKNQNLLPKWPIKCGPNQEFLFLCTRPPSIKKVETGYTYISATAVATFLFINCLTARKCLSNNK